LGRTEDSAYRHANTGSGRTRTNRRYIDRLRVLDTDFDEIETHRLDPINGIKRLVGEGRNPDERACAVPHSMVPERSWTETLDLLRTAIKHIRGVAMPSRFEIWGAVTTACSALARGVRKSKSGESRKGTDPDSPNLDFGTRVP
jgi:hypothetical protein